MSPKIQFLGAAGTVTGSKYLLSFGEQNVLVDCGLFQGVKSLRLKNWDGFPIEASKVNAIILTHAHLDHSGFIPRLIKKGFRGPIYCTEATRDLCKILLPDAGHLMQEEAEYLNRKKRSKHSPALPLFTQEEAEQALSYFHPVPLREIKKIGSNFSFELQYAGHILGAASAVVSVAGTKIGFSGDIGRLDDSLFFPPAPIPPVDYLVVESTYGDKLHKSVDVLDELEKVINETFDNKGVIIIPAFAVGRVQALMHYLWTLKKQKRIPDFPMYLNSPMATNVNYLLDQHRDLHRLSEDECKEVCDVVQYVRTVEESIAVNEKNGPMLIISASGMLTGGRVLHHLKRFAPFPQNLILLSGFQAAGTRGESLEKGAEEIKIHGEYIPVRAQIKVLDNISAHADYKEIIKWLEHSNIHPKKVFVTHGEASSADQLRRRLSERFGWNCVVPDQDKISYLDQDEN